MADVLNFTPLASNTSLVLSVVASAHTAVQLSNMDGYSGGELLLSNQGTTVWVFVAFGATASAAQTNAAIPSDGAYGAVIPVPPGWQIGITVPPGQFISAIASAAGPTNLWVTQGTGAA